MFYDGGGGGGETAHEYLERSITMQSTANKKKIIRHKQPHSPLS